MSNLTNFRPTIITEDGGSLIMKDEQAYMSWYGVFMCFD